MHVSLTPTLEDYTREKIKSGLYNNASEVIRESLRLMIERDAQKKNLREALALGFEQIEHGKFAEVSTREEFLALAREL